jgi:hypothetical protein
MRPTPRSSPPPDTLPAHGIDDRGDHFLRQPVPVCKKMLKYPVGAGQVQTRRPTAPAPTVEVFCEHHGYRDAFIWEQNGNGTGNISPMRLQRQKTKSAS